MAMLLLFYQFFSSRYKFRAYLSLTIKNFDRMSLGAGWGSESEQLIYIFRLMYYWLIVITCSCYTNQTTGSFDLVADHMILLNLHDLTDDLTKDIKHRVDCDDAERWRSRDYDYVMTCVATEGETETKRWPICTVCSLQQSTEFGLTYLNVFWLDLIHKEIKPFIIFPYYVNCSLNVYL